MKALLIIRLIGLLMFTGTAGVFAAGESPNSANHSLQPGHVTGSIRDPLNPQAYMAELASKLKSSDGKDLLLKGMPAGKAQKTGVSRANVSPSKPAASSGNPAKIAGAAPSEQKPQETKKEPVPEVPAMMVWNGLSPDNRAAQRVLEDLEASRMAKASALSRSVGNGQTDTAPAAPPAQTTTAGQNAREVVPLNQALMSAKPGLTLWTTPTPANLVEKIIIDASGAQKDPNAANAARQERTPWSLGSDLDKYRAHAVKEGSRDSGQSLKKALEKAGLAIGDGVNVFILGYGSDRAKPFRTNDGKGFLDDPGKVPQRAGTTVVSLADGVYSLADLIAFDSLPDPIKDAYQDNNPLVRPLIFTGQAIGGVWKTTEEIGNAVTWGLFDNVTGCVGIVIEDILELFKHVGQAATNLVRAPVQLVVGKKEGTERAMDWVLLVPLEFVSNSIEMKGIANMDGYKTAFEDKGVIGSVLEFGGSTFLVYRMVDELVDELEKDNHRRKATNSESTPETPTEPTPTPSAPTSEILILVEGEWPTVTSSPGIIYFDGQGPTITIFIQ